MTWRGRVSLGDDLRRLHESARASDMSREIGYSSVTEGEGSLDLLTESGDVRASFGDQPDGRFGVSIWHGGQLRFIPDLIQELQDEDGSLSDRMVGAEGRLDGHDSTLASHNTRIGNAQSRADDAWTRAGTGIADAATAQSRADSAWTRAGTGIANAATAQSRADSAYTLAETAYTQNGTTYDLAAAAWGRATTALSNAATAQARADNAHTRIDGLNYASPGDIATLSNRIQALRSEVHDWMQTARASNPSLPPPIPD